MKLRQDHSKVWLRRSFYCRYEEENRQRHLLRVQLEHGQQTSPAHGEGEGDKKRNEERGAREGIRNQELCSRGRRRPKEKPREHVMEWLGFYRNQKLGEGKGNSGAGEV